MSAHQRGVHHRVIVVGAGPGGLSAAARLRERGGEGLDVRLVADGARATFLAGTLDVVLGEAEPDSFTTPLALDRIEVIDALADRVAPDGVAIGTQWLSADAVIAAPGLTLGPLPDWSRAVSAWDPAGAARARAGLPIVSAGRMLVAACGFPYRCPTAPFALAVGLLGQHMSDRHMTGVVVATPESVPLAGVGGEAPALVLEACASAGVTVELGFAVDLNASEDGVLRAGDGRELRYDGAFLISPHVRTGCLAGLPGDGPLVDVGERGSVHGSMLYVVGDAAATGLPRAAGMAAGVARQAADEVLERLGLAQSPAGEQLTASCFMFHHGGAVSRLRVSFPTGSPLVEVDGPSFDLRSAREGERRRFLALAGGVTVPALTTLARPYGP